MDTPEGNKLVSADSVELLRSILEAPAFQTRNSRGSNRDRRITTYFLCDTWE
jgi:hypothetical protein